MLTNLYEIVKQRAAAHPDAIAIGGQHGLGWKMLTSVDLLAAVDRLAVELTAAGVGDGDRVVVWLPGHWQTPVYFLALWKLGAVVVPFDREMNPEAGAAILEAVEPRLVLAGYGERPPWARGRDVTEWWEPGSRDAGTPGPPVAHGDGERRGNGDAEIGGRGVGETRGHGGAETLLPASGRGGAERLAALYFTSGTTGQPKGCMITHANLLSQVEALAGRIPLDRSCRLASFLPLSH
jgi:long-chain acyl-CoA synthetase